MSSDKLCVICHKRKAQRYCPGLQESICAVCCGTEREVKIDCPLDCSYLQESRRYDMKRSKPPAALPFPEIEAGDSFLAEHEQFIGQIALVLLRHAMEHPKTVDRDIEAAVESMVRTYQTLSSGIYYESLPEETQQVAAFRALKSFLDDHQQKARERGQTGGVKESEIIRCLAFVARIAVLHDNKRPRSRAFIDFLRHMYPDVNAAKEEPGLIIPGA